MITQDDIDAFKHDDAKIKIVEIVEHEDGSAYVSMTMNSEIYGKIFSEGFIHLLEKGLEESKV